jgi:hypothetical protein
MGSILLGLMDEDIGLMDYVLVHAVEPLGPDGRCGRPNGRSTSAGWPTHPAPVFFPSCSILRDSDYWHLPLTHSWMPGHSQSALQPATHAPLTQIMPEPSVPGLQSPSPLHAGEPASGSLGGGVGAEHGPRGVAVSLPRSRVVPASGLRRVAARHRLALARAAERGQVVRARRRDAARSPRAHARGREMPGRRTGP